MTYSFAELETEYIKVQNDPILGDGSINWRKSTLGFKRSIASTPGTDLC